MTVIIQLAQFTNTQNESWFKAHQTYLLDESLWFIFNHNIYISAYMA